MKSIDQLSLTRVAFVCAGIVIALRYRTSACLMTAHAQAFLLVQPVDTLFVHTPALQAELHSRPQVSPRDVPASDLLDPTSQCRLIVLH